MVPAGTGEGWGSQPAQFALMVVGTAVEALIRLRHLVVALFLFVVILG